MKTANTIAVLPLRTIGEPSNSHFFAEGITEEIIHALAKINGLRVTSRRSSSQFKDDRHTLKEIANLLKVSFILEGSVRIYEDTIRIQTHLIDTVEDLTVWSESWDRKTGNLFSIQDEVSLLIADQLREYIGHLEIADQLVKTQTQNLDAYSLFLQARQLFNQWNPEDVNQAIPLLEQAISLDPKHAESYVGLADAYGFLGTTQFLPPDQAWKQVAQYTHRALELDPHNAGAHYQLANLSFFTQFDFVNAVKHTQRSIELMPSYPEARQFMSFLYLLSGQIKSAKKHLQHAIDINPLSLETQFFQAYFLYKTEDYNAALNLLEKNLEENPNNIPAIVTKCYCLLQLSRYQESIDFLNGLPDAVKVPGDVLGISCLALTMMGKQDEAQKLIQEMKEGAKDPLEFQLHAYLFLYYAQINDYDLAFEVLEKGIQQNSPVLLLSFSDPLIGDLVHDPRYQAYRQKVYPVLIENPISSKALFETQEANKIEDDLNAFLEEERPYLNPSLTLRSLAQQLGLNPNQLSWIINERKGINFNHYINQYRVLHFQKLLQDPDHSHISLIGLAYQSGFNSKTVFNTFFKKSVGMTPGQYHKSVQKGSDL